MGNDCSTCCSNEERKDILDTKHMKKELIRDMLGVDTERPEDLTTPSPNTKRIQKM